MVELQLLDARGMNCPLPLLKLKQRLNQMTVGERVQVKTTDPGSVRDFAAFIQQTGHCLHDQHKMDGEFIFLIEKLV